MGHLLISCGSCHDELWSTTFYEPPHDITHRQAGPFPASTWLRDEEALSEFVSFALTVGRRSS